MGSTCSLRERSQDARYEKLFNRGKIFYSQCQGDANCICIFDEDITRIVYLYDDGSVFQTVGTVNTADIMKGTEKEADKQLTELWYLMR